MKLRGELGRYLFPWLWGQREGMSHCWAGKETADAGRKVKFKTAALLVQLPWDGQLWV